MAEKEVALVVFDSTNLALKTEKLLKSTGVPCTVIPTPVEVTADCGIALLVEVRWLEPAREVIDSAGPGGITIMHPYTRGRDLPQP